ncbi:hypothetical protein A3A20_02260 [Candidatus Wolfebacteria bacterium RIFCSPLOWO2_01_FULL_45_19]|uniref:Glycogen synthase n=1 Tax=Candidatus Wolfebacteria bacterium RIFCSPLOWO2_01_FULL_45_19 TaxID=1802557 RepID=A0A1F8DVC1_9BACT|nr:MAG: Glycogen synthase [Parcubacteria group bacterium GW2011_GWB1_45_9]OGM91735.1 MAG: hypothetical protein A3A20_02260 [Candidatus Wolfebacteria bacterium RIFCSPLOWO2_01_FULL_45_19]
MASFIPSIPSIFGKKAAKILFISPEAAPFVKVGGLGEVMRALPKALRELGYDARVLTPKYASMNLENFPLTKIYEGLEFVPEELDPHGLFVCNVLQNESEEDVVAYFLENMEYFEKRANVYGYADDTVRWVLLCKAALEFIKQSDWVPDIIVTNDWQTGFLPDFLKHSYHQHRKLSGIKTMFIIHNLNFQGMFDHRFLSETDYDSGQAAIPELGDPNILKLNGMRRGIMWSDLIVTVSPTYSKEILTTDFGEGLNELLKEKRSVLFGVLNGIDYDIYNPQKDKLIPHPFSYNNLEKRALNKTALQEKFNLKVDPRKFVIGIVSRMDEQKGFELIMQICNPLFENVDFQMVVVGGGDNKYRLFFQEMEKKYPGRFGGHYFYDEILPRLVFAGADAILVPSRFEPSGLVQMEAMRYGAIPIVRHVGGLADSVRDFDGEQGDGFVFNNYDPYALLVAIVRAKETFSNKKTWTTIVSHSMQNDFSWKKSAQDYDKLFNILLDKK